MTGLLWAEVRRFGVRPAIRWIAAAMLLHVALTVLVTAFVPPAASLAELLEHGRLSFFSVTSSALAAVLLAYVAGVLLVTGESASGGTRTLLTVEPRRGRVYWSKVAAAALAVVPGVAAASALLAGGLYGVHARSGTLGGPASDLVPVLAWAGVRVIALAVCAAAAGAALGVLVRRWWVAVGLAVVWFLVEEILLGPASRAADWFVLGNAEAWVRGAGTVSSGEGTLAVPLLHGGLLLLGVTVVLTVLGGAVFRRRDVR